MTVAVIAQSERDPARIVFSGVGKTDAEMARALELSILCFNVESASELAQKRASAVELVDAAIARYPDLRKSLPAFWSLPFASDTGRDDLLVGTRSGSPS